MAGVRRLLLLAIFGLYLAKLLLNYSNRANDTVKGRQVLMVERPGQLSLEGSAHVVRENLIGRVQLL